MGEVRTQNEKPSCIPDASYSARLLWKIVSQTKVIVSVLDADRALRGRVSLRTREWVENHGLSRQHVEKERDVQGSNWTDVKRKGRRKGKNGCYLCKLQNNPSKSSIETSSPFRWPSYPNSRPLNPSPSSPSHSIYLPITHSQPPNPPQRSTSLPYYKILKRLSHIQIITSPHAPLADFHLSRQDGYIFQYLVRSIQFRGSIWNLLLQTSHEEPSIRLLLLAVGNTHLCRISHSDSDDPDGLSRRIFVYYFHAIRYLRLWIESSNGMKDSQIWDICFKAVYLLIYLYSTLGNRAAAMFYLTTGHRVLRRALRVFGSGDGEEGKELPGGMREVALAFSRVDLRSLVKGGD